MLAGAERMEKLGPDTPPILLVHGDQDPMIPVSALFASATALGRAGACVQWHISSGIGHSIDQDGLVLGGEFLAMAFQERLARTGEVNCAVG